MADYTVSSATGKSTFWKSRCALHEAGNRSEADILNHPTERAIEVISIFKLVGATLQRDGADLKRDLMGFRGLGAHEEVGFTGDELKATEEFMHLRTTTIYDGSNEVQANIIAKRVFGLPD